MVYAISVPNKISCSFSYYWPWSALKIVGITHQSLHLSAPSEYVSNLFYAFSNVKFPWLNWDTFFHWDCEQTCMSISGQAPFWGCFCCSSTGVHGLVSRKSCFSCFSVFPTGEPSHCGQEGETLLWSDFSMQCTCCVSPAKYGEGTPRGTDSECVGDLEKKNYQAH